MLKIGDVFAVNEGMLVYSIIPREFCKAIARFRVGDVFNNGIEIYDTSIFIGDYVVEEASFVYNNYWKVTSRKLFDNGKYNLNGIKIFFFQGGKYYITSVVHEKVPVLRTMIRSFI